jgi:DNA-binding LacI/PurR family transcriptional regulator
MTKINIHDVAREAGVHRSTVSRALTGSGPVSEENRRRVLEAAKKLNYHPNTVAGQLKSKRRNTWGFLSFWYSTPNSADAYYSKALGGLLDAANQVGHRLLLQNVVGRFDQNEDCLRFCHDSQLGGVVILAPRTEEAGLKELKRLSIPAVILAYRPRDPELNFVDLDNVKGAALAVAHLASRGHKRIGFIGGELELSANARDRYDGYVQAMKAAGLSLDKALVRHGTFDPNFAVGAARELLSYPKEQRPSAMFCATDMMALGVIRTAESLGLKVPRDLAVAGLDDNHEVQIPGGLTTVRYPFFEAAQRAGEILRRLTREPQSAPLHVLLEPELIIRGST